MAAYRRSIFLINRKFQLRFAVYVCSWLLAISFVYPLIIYRLFNYFLHYVRLDPMGPAFTTLERTRGEVLWLLILFQFIFLVLSFLMSIFMSHRIAGPIHKLRKFMNEAKGGNYNHLLAFRKKDHFSELADDFNDLMHKLRDGGASAAPSAGSNDIIGSAIAQIERALPQTSGDARRDLESALESLRRVSG